MTKDQPIVECSLQEEREQLQRILEDPMLPQIDVQLVRIINWVNDLLESRYYDEPGLLRLIPSRSPFDDLENEEALEEFKNIPNRTDGAPSQHIKETPHHRIGSGPGPEHIDSIEHKYKS